MRTRSPTAEASPRWTVAGDGVEMRPLVGGGGTALVLYRIESGRTFASHTHPFPEYGSVILGRGRLVLEGRAQELAEGDSYYIPCGVSHGFESPAQPGPVVLLHVGVGSENEGSTGMFRELIERTSAVVRA